MNNNAFHRFLQRNRKCLRGYSLVEVLVVVALISIGSSIALYQYTAFRNSIGVDTSSQIVRRMLILAKNRAINTALPHEVLIDLDANVLWVDQVNASGTERKPRVIPNEAMVEDVVIDSIKINGTPFLSGVQTVRFEPDGSNPLITVLVRKGNADPSLDSNFTSIRLYPSSSEPKIYEDQKK